MYLKNRNSFRLVQIERVCSDKFKFDENGGVFYKRIGNTERKREILITSNFSFYYGVFKRFILQTRKNKGFFGNGLINFSQEHAFFLVFQVL